MKKRVFLVLCLLLGWFGWQRSDSGPQSQPVQEILAQEAEVRDALKDAELSTTAKSVCITDEVPAHTEQLLSRKEASISYPFVKACGELNSNPVSTFLKLADQGLYNIYRTEEGIVVYGTDYDEYAVLCKLEESPGMDTIKEYRNYRDEAEFLQDVLKMSALLEDGIGLEEQILKAANNLQDFGLKKSKEEQVSYVYYVYSTDLSANILCFYIHHEDEQEQISDVEFQLLTLSYYRYRENVPYDENSFDIDFGNAAQILSLIDAVEMNLTGTSLFHQQTTMHISAMHGYNVDIPAEYTIGDYKVTIQQWCYDTSALGAPRYDHGYETAVLTTYRIQK